MTHISFNIGRGEAKIVREIIDRAAAMSERVTGKKLSNEELRGWTMDLIACHANDCPIDFGRLLALYAQHLWLAWWPRLDSSR